jgi:hypothetical protein
MTQLEDYDLVILGDGTGVHTRSWTFAARVLDRDVAGPAEGREPEPEATSTGGYHRSSATAGPCIVDSLTCGTPRQSGHGGGAVACPRLENKTDPASGERDRNCPNSDLAPDT